MSEHDDQAAFVGWCRLMSRCYPGLALIHAIPNGGGRSRREAGRLKAEGVLAGVPDLFLPVARGGYHGLYIELKRSAVGAAPRGRISRVQADVMTLLRAQGYATTVCYGYAEAIAAVERYFTTAREE